MSTGFYTYIGEDGRKYSRPGVIVKESGRGEPVEKKTKQKQPPMCKNWESHFSITVDTSVLIPARDRITPSRKNIIEVIK